MEDGALNIVRRCFVEETTELLCVPLKLLSSSVKKFELQKLIKPISIQSSYKVTDGLELMEFPGFKGSKMSRAPLPAKPRR